MPLLLLLFVGSGAAALIYEIVWFQLLQLVIGSSAVSLYTNPASNYHRGLTVSGTNLRDRATPQRTRRQHHG